MIKTNDFVYAVNKWLRKLFPMQQFSNVCDKCNGDGFEEFEEDNEFGSVLKDCPQCCESMLCSSCGSELSEYDHAEVFSSLGKCPFCIA